MAHICLQRQAELDIVLEDGRELGAISDGSPVICDEYRLRGVQGHHCLDLSGVKSLEQRRDKAFGFSWKWKALGHQGLLFVLVELRCGDDTHVVAVINRKAGRTFPIVDAYGFHGDGEWRGASPQSICKSRRVTQAATASRRASSGNSDRLSTLCEG